MEIMKQNKMKEGGRQKREGDRLPHNVIVICQCGTVEKYQREAAAGDKEDLIFLYYIFILTHAQRGPEGFVLAPAFERLCPLCCHSPRHSSISTATAISIDI